jgi:uncharacterized oligopeptide transporter (OPT) family protein
MHGETSAWWNSIIAGEVRENAAPNQSVVTQEHVILNTWGLIVGNQLAGVIAALAICLQPH